MAFDFYRSLRSVYMCDVILYYTEQIIVYLLPHVCKEEILPSIRVKTCAVLHYPLIVVYIFLSSRLPYCIYIME